MPEGATLRWRFPDQPQFRFRVGAAMAPAIGPAPALVPLAVIIGPVGPAGPPGEGGRYEHSQSSPSAIWTVNHNLGVRPAAVSIRSTGGVEVEAQVTHLSDNQCVINFAVPFAGTAHVI